MRTKTHTTKKAVSAKRTRTTRTTKSVKTTKKATPKSLKGLNGKLKVTQKYVKSIYDDILKIGYCDLQNLLKYEYPKYYTAGTYGWNADVYSFGNLAIVTGYRPFGRHIDKKLVDKYEYKAMKMSEKYKNDKIAKKHFDKLLIREFISEALSTTKKATPKSLKGLCGNTGVIPIRKLSVEALEQGLWQNRLCDYESLNSYYADELNEAGKKRALLKFYKDLSKSDKKVALETARNFYEYRRR